MSLQFSVNISDQLQTRQISLISPKILQCHQGMTLNHLIIKKIAFYQSIKAIRKFKIKSKFLFHHVSTKTIKRIINDLDIKKPSSGEIQTYFIFFKKKFFCKSFFLFFISQYK